MLLGSLLVAVGCGGPNNTSSPPTQWLGTMRHLRVAGTIHGPGAMAPVTSVDINLTGATAADTTKVWCEREYQIPNDSSGMPIYSMGHDAEVRARSVLAFNGQMVEVDIGLKRHDWQRERAGNNVMVIPRVDSMSPCTLASCTNTTAWLSWAWRDPANNFAVLYKAAATSGTITLGEYVGTPDANGLEIPPNTGDIGAFATGQWSASESLAISFDANCTTNNVDNSY
jgi:hypothetical protein